MPKKLNVNGSRGRRVTNDDDVDVDDTVAMAAAMAVMVRPPPLLSESPPGSARTLAFQLSVVVTLGAN